MGSVRHWRLTARSRLVSCPIFPGVLYPRSCLNYLASIIVHFYTRAHQHGVPNFFLDAMTSGCGVAAGPLRQRLLAAASACATDPNSRVSLKWLQFLQETATAHAAEIDEELPALIAACVEALGAPSSACRQTAVQALHTSQNRH